MIFASIDVDKENLKEVLESLVDIRRSKFDGVELCLWEDMIDYAPELRDELRCAGLQVNIHGDLMRLEDGFERCREKMNYGLRFSQILNARHFISHPIKPYLHNLLVSKRLLKEFNLPILIESVKGLGLEELVFLNKPVVLDIGSIFKNAEFNRLPKYKNVKWLHLHDSKDGRDHYPLGDGTTDFRRILSLFPNTGCTIELNDQFRKWHELREQYRNSVDFLNNLLLCNNSFGKNVRLQHLQALVGDASFQRTVELGCGEGYLLHNVRSGEKSGYDTEPIELFNDISYFRKDIRDLLDDHADLVICSEVLEHIDADDLAIKNISRILRPGGLVFLSTVNKNTQHDKSEIDKIRGHKRRYGLELEKLLNENGLKTISFYPFRSSHYYKTKQDLSNYDYETDILLAQNYASGWIFLGTKCV